MQFIGNPRETCDKMYAVMLRLLERIDELKDDPKCAGTSDTVIIMSLVFSDYISNRGDAHWKKLVPETCTVVHDQNCVVWLVGCVWKFQWLQKITKFKRWFGCEVNIFQRVVEWNLNPFGHGCRMKGGRLMKQWCLESWWRRPRRNDWMIYKNSVEWSSIVYTESPEQRTAGRIFEDSCNSHQWSLSLWISSTVCWCWKL